MKKSLLIIVALATLLFSSSSLTTRVSDGKVGYIAPTFNLNNADTALSLQHLKGKYVLLSFWSSCDATSRIRNIQYDRAVEKLDNRLNLISVNYDQNESVYHEIVKRDKLDAESQFYDQDGLKSNIFSDYHLDNGFKSYLINPAGEIVALNPSNQELAQLICQ